MLHFQERSQFAGAGGNLGTGALFVSYFVGVVARLSFFIFAFGSTGPYATLRSGVSYGLARVLLEAYTLRRGLRR